MTTYKSNKMTLGEVVNSPKELEIDCHAYCDCLSRDNCYHLQRVPKQFETLKEFPGCSGTNGKPWTKSGDKEFSNLSVHQRL